jgi:2-polyprenyl-6-methoxyphenol hydroxylase-like FAD-dependent oxidoreductase
VTRAVIAGGGIVGLTAGRALLQAGMEVLVAEQADAIRAAGATLGLWGNAVSVFDDLDVDVRSIAREAEMYFHGTSGQLLKTPEFSDEDHRYLLVHRASLNNLLAESVGYDNIRLEAAVVGFEEDQDSVTIRFSDGSTEQADVFIGADGLYSNVRAQLFPGTEAQEHVGHRASNVLTTVDGNIAQCRAMVDAWHTVPTDPGVADFYTARNNWLLRLERVDGRWLITEWTIVKAAPSDGYQGVYQVARARAGQAQTQ